MIGDSHMRNCATELQHKLRCKWFSLQFYKTRCRNGYNCKHCKRWNKKVEEL